MQCWGPGLSQQAPRAHTRLGCSQLNLVSAQSVTACWNLATARVSSQHTHCWATMCVLSQRMGSAQSGSWETHQLHLRGWRDECWRSSADTAECWVFIATGNSAAGSLVWQRHPCQRGWYLGARGKRGHTITGRRGEVDVQLICRKVSKLLLFFFSFFL